MQYTSRQIFKEFNWLLLPVVLTILVAIFLFGQSFFSGYLDMHIHDSYFVLPGWYLLVPLYFGLVFFLYYFRTFRQQYSNTFCNWVVVVAGLALLIFLSFLLRIFSHYLSGGWTLYPPLSRLATNRVNEISDNPWTTTIIKFLASVQVIVLVLLLWSVYKMGQRRK